MPLLPHMPPVPKVRPRRPGNRFDMGSRARQRLTARGWPCRLQLQQPATAVVVATPAYLQYPITYGTSIPGFTSDGCAPTKPNCGGFSLAPKRSSAVSLHNTRMAKRRRLNAHYNRRYGTNTYISSDTWFLRQSYMSQPTMWLREQIFNGNGNSICW